MRVRLRYIALALLLTITAPMVRQVIEYCGQVKATYDLGKQVQETSKVMLAQALPVRGKK